MKVASEYDFWTNIKMTHYSPFLCFALAVGQYHYRQAGCGTHTAFRHNILHFFIVLSLRQLLSRYFNNSCQFWLYISQFWLYITQLRVYISEFWLYITQLRVYISEFWLYIMQLRVYISEFWLYITQLRVYISEFWLYITQLRVYISEFWLYIMQLRVYISEFWLYITQLRVYISQLREKKSELWDKKSQLPCFIFYSVAETGFHITVLYI